jgi:hypothetical protein
MIYMASYRPLVATDSGADAAARYSLPPYVEGSCRREPDLEHDFPGISSLCRGPSFPRRLRVGDTVVYVTIKASYPGLTVPHWRLAAVLKVIERCDNHEAAAAWYRERELPLPSNCLVEDNEPVPMHLTTGLFKLEGKTQRPLGVDEWDEQFQERVREEPLYFICEPLYQEVSRPPAITEPEGVRVFGEKGMPGTRSPSPLTEEQLSALMKACRITLPEA